VTDLRQAIEEYREAVGEYIYACSKHGGDADEERVALSVAESVLDEAMKKLS
jgi:hypothetical protein